jgi:hypothetical protein
MRVRIQESLALSVLCGILSTLGAVDAASVSLTTQSFNSAASQVLSATHSPPLPPSESPCVFALVPLGGLLTLISLSFVLKSLAPEARGP